MFSVPLLIRPLQVFFFNSYASLVGFCDLFQPFFPSFLPCFYLLSWALLFNPCSFFNFSLNLDFSVSLPFPLSFFYMNFLFSFFYSFLLNFHMFPSPPFHLISYINSLSRTWRFLSLLYAFPEMDGRQSDAAPFAADTQVWPPGHGSEQSAGDCGICDGWAAVTGSGVSKPWRRPVAVAEAVAQRLPGLRQAVQCSRWSMEVGKLGEGTGEKERHKEWELNKDRVKKQEEWWEKGRKSVKEDVDVLCSRNISWS